MAIIYNFKARGNLLTVKASGSDDDLDEVKQYGMAVVEAAMKAATPRILCDERELEYQLGTAETHECAEFVASNAPHIARIALVTQPGQRKNIAFWENVMVKRGMTVRVFTNLEDAEAWLSR